MCLWLSYLEVSRAAHVCHVLTLSPSCLLLKKSQLPSGCKAWLRCHLLECSSLSPLIVNVLLTSYHIYWPWNLGWGLLNYVNNLTVFHRTLVITYFVQLWVYNLGSVFFLCSHESLVPLITETGLGKPDSPGLRKHALREEHVSFGCEPAQGRLKGYSPLLLVFTRVEPSWSTSVLVVSSPFLGPAGFCVQRMDTGANTPWCWSVPVF